MPYYFPAKSPAGLPVNRPLFPDHPWNASAYISPNRHLHFPGTAVPGGYPERISVRL